MMKCWEYLNCPENAREGCPAFTSKNGIECWKVTETICKGGTEKKGTIEEKLVECTKCSYYINVLKNKGKKSL